MPQPDEGNYNKPRNEKPATNIPQSAVPEILELEMALQFLARALIKLQRSDDQFQIKEAVKFFSNL